MKKLREIALAVSIFSLPLPLFAGNYINYPYYYFSIGYDYGKYLTLKSKVRLQGYGIFIPVKGEKTFAYYHFLLSQYGYKPVAVRGGIIAKVARDKSLLTKDLEIIKEKIRIPAEIKQVNTTGYIFVLDKKMADIQQKPAKPNSKETKALKGQLPIDLVIADLEKAIKDAEKIGQVEPQDIRTIYQLEFDKEKLIKHLRAILEGLKQFKRMFNKPESNFESDL